MELMIHTNMPRYTGNSTIIPRLKPNIRRRTLSYFREHYTGFMGWKKLINYFKIADTDAKIILVGLFVFGCRANELNTLKKSQIDFDYSPTQIQVSNMAVLKKKEKIYLVDDDGEPLLKDNKKAFTFNSIEGYRTFYIPKSEPFSNTLQQYVENWYGDEPDDSFLFPYTRSSMYYRITTIGSKIPVGESKDSWWKYKNELWLHRLRAERACQLIKEYHYDTLRLKRWFNWSDTKQAEVYGDIMPTDLIVDVPKDFVYR